MRGELKIARNSSKGEVSKTMRKYVAFDNTPIQATATATATTTAPLKFSMAI